MIDLSRKTVLFFDASAGYTHMAEAVIPDFGRVLYHSIYETAFPHPKNYLPGSGISGLERVDDFYEALEVADLVVFTDVGNDGLQEYLRHQGMPVFGSGNGGKLEQDRLLLKSTCKKAGIDVGPYFVIRGIDNLREYLSQNPEEVYIKVSFWRGLTETEHFESMLKSKPWLDRLSLDAGPFGARLDFLIEKPIDEKPCVEVGIDTYNANGMFPETIMWGYEAEKDSCYVGTISPLPERLAKVAGRLAPVLESYRYRGPISTETRETGEGSYMIDFTARHPEPPSSLQSFMMTNLAEIYWEVAHGRMIEPDFAAQIGVQIVWKSAEGADHPLAVDIGRKDRVTIHGHCIAEGQDYAVSPSELEEQGGACGMGSSLASALEDAIDAANSIEGRGVKFNTGDLEKIAEKIEAGNKLGITWR